MTAKRELEVTME